MTGITAKSSRRSFFLTGGAMLGAGVATAGAAVLMSDAQPERRDDREALRQLQLTFMSLIETQAYDAAAELFTEQAQLHLSGMSAAGKPAIRQLFAEQYRGQLATSLHSAYRQNALQRNDAVTFSSDHLRANAMFHTEVQISTPLRTDSTVAQMARLQGQMAESRWENGRFEAQYVKTQGQWQIATLRYLAL